MRIDLFHSILITLLASSMLLLVNVICFHRRKIMLHLGYQAFFLIIGILVLLILLPVEFVASREIYIPEIISKYLAEFRSPFFSSGKISISLSTIFFIFWIVGIFICLVKEIIDLSRIHKQIRLYGRDLTGEEPYASLLGKICGERKRSRLHVVSWSGVKVPCLMGVWKPYILLPEDAGMTEEELFLVLRHECAHYLHHDILVKFLVKWITILYWWNPIFRYLNRQIDVVLDMRIDDQLTVGNKELKKDYLACLLNIAHSAASSAPQPDASLALSACRNFSSLEKRFDMLLKKKKQRGIYTGILFITVFLILFSSYYYSLEIYYTPPEVKENFILLSHDNFYAILNAEGKYELYLFGQHIETVDSMEHYPKDSLIYNTKGELISDE